MADGKTYSFGNLGKPKPKVEMIPLSMLSIIESGLLLSEIRYYVGLADTRFGRWPLRTPVDPETAAASRARARGLLKSMLRPDQWAEFERTGRFNERIGEDEFLITPGGMITRKRGPLVERWCVNPDPYADKNDFIPVEDMAIGQLLHLRSGPEKVRAMSNVFPDALRPDGALFLNPRAVWGTVTS